MLTFEEPPATDQPAPTKAEVARALVRNPERWAVVARADREARAARLVASINDGSYYGPGVVAVFRKVGSECRVYAKFTRLV